MSEPRPTYAVTEWHGCYDDSWNGVIREAIEEFDTFVGKFRE